MGVIYVPCSSTLLYAMRGGPMTRFPGHGVMAFAVLWRGGAGGGPAYSCKQIRLHPQSPSRHAMSLKRYRETPRSPSPSPPTKLSHFPIPRPYTCTLPPTCHVHHTHYHSQYHLERHHDIFHRWVCTASVRVREDHAEDAPQSFVAQRGWKKWRECLKVFPEERLLDLVRLSFLFFIVANIM